MVTLIAACSFCFVAKLCPFVLTMASFLEEKISVLVVLIVSNEAPDQNRTDTSSLEGYGSTIELQAPK